MRQSNKINWKWSIALGALVALIGCAGNSGGSGTSSTSSTAGSTASTAGTTGTTGLVFPGVAVQNLPDTPAYLQYVFLTGAGRASGDENAKVRKMEISDSNGSVATDLTERTLTLNRPTSQILAANATLLGSPSRLFNSIVLNVIEYTNEDDGGVSTFDTVDGLPVALAADVRGFRGRQSHIPLYVDPEIINVANVGGSAVAQFNPTWFDTINRIEGDSVAVRGFLSDFVCFDVSLMPASSLPTLSQGFGVANRILFSGDQYAIANGDPNVMGAPFEMLFPHGQAGSIIGRYSAPVAIPGGPGRIAPGTFTTLNADPGDVSTTDPALIRKITSFQGTWKNYFQQWINGSGTIEDVGYFSNLHNFEAISIPSSLDNPRQDVVFVSNQITTDADGTKSAKATNLMWGYVDIETRQLFIYPASNLGDIDATTNRVGEVTGNLSTMYTATGSITSNFQSARYIDFAFTGTVPSGFPATGKIVVLRR